RDHQRRAPGGRRRAPAGGHAGRDLAPRSGRLPRRDRGDGRPAGMIVADAEALCDLAHTWARHGRYREAENAYREAARLDPGRLKAYLGLGLVLRRQRRSAEAEAIFRQAILLSPQAGTAHLELGGALFE